tara:strand:+ start:44 stop:484 length:441 start_codon:yes stop_codon:yes gene_type:complete
MSGFFNLIKHGPKIVKTVASPITHARNIIKSKFQKTSPTITSVKPKGGTKKSDQIKKSNKILKDLDKTMKKDMTPELKAKGDKLKKEVQKTQKEVYRSKFNTGSKDPVGKKKNKFPDHSGDGQITQKDILMAKGVIPKTKSKKKVI